ncbi:MAG: hypothetical protein NVS3B26_11640 [Mycobacteriales bacterium]
MTRTSQALKRLGVAAIAVATIGAGVPALIATSASATNATNTSVSITPTSEAGAVSTCNPYTVSVTPADTTTVDIQISQTTATGTATIGFCTPPAGSGTNPQAAPSVTTTSTVIGTTSPTFSSTCANPNNSTTTTCDAEYTTNTGTFTFGVISNTVGTLNVTAFVEPTTNATNTGGNATGNNQPGPGKNQATATKYVVANANNAVTSVACTPKTATNPTNTTHIYSCTAYTTAGGSSTVPVRGVTITPIITSGPDKGVATVTCGQLDGNTPPAVTTGNAAYGTTTNNQGVVYCSLPNTSNVPGTDNVFNYVERNGLPGPQADEPADQIAKTFVGQARYIVCSPKTVTANYGQDATITCTVTDVNGNPVAKQPVDFTATFPGGRFATGSNPGTFASTVSTDAAGVATIKINNPDQTTPQSQTVTATIQNTAGSECNKAAGATNSGVTTTATTPTAGNCTDTVTVKYVVPASPSATPTASVSPSSSPRPTPTGSNNTPPARQPLNLTVDTPEIPAGATARLTGTGSASQQYELQCYTRPSTTYFTARSGAFDAAGDPVQFTLALGRNTRCFLQYATQSNSGASLSVVVNVHTVLSLSTVRTGVRTYIFQGRNLPRAAGQLITLYRVDSSGHEIRATNLVTDASGIYRVTRTFTGTGTFRFKVRTSTTLNNANGVSNTILVRVF